MSSVNEPTVPQNLLNIQRWFGKVVRLPLDSSITTKEIPEFTPFLQAECGLHLTDGPELSSHQRMGIYNRLYWFRFFGVLHEFYPLLTRLFGYKEFNQKIVQPYLLKYAPNHWSLHHIGDHLLQWIQEEYSANDKELVYWCAVIDNAYQKVFLSKSQPPIAEVGIGNLGLQPYVCLFEMPAHFFSYRDQFLEHGVDYWREENFPELEIAHTYYFVLYRNSSGEVCYEEICLPRYLILKGLQEGSNLSSLFQLLEKESEEVYTQAAEGIERWFCEWVSRGWLC